MCGKVQVDRSLGFYREVDDTLELGRTFIAFTSNIPLFVKNVLQKHKTQET